MANFIDAKQFGKIPPFKLLTRRDLIQGGAALAVASALPGCNSALSPAAGKTVFPIGSAKSQPAPGFGTQYPNTATLTVAETPTHHVVQSWFAGLSFEKSDLRAGIFNGSNANLIALFKGLYNSSGISLVRFGGNNVDQSMWGYNTNSGTGYINQDNIDDLADFLSATGWKCLYGINLGAYESPHPFVTDTTPPITIMQTKQMAADEIYYVRNHLPSGSLYALEIGNEPNDYTTTYWSGSTWTATQLESKWEDLRTAILNGYPNSSNASPSVIFTGPATGNVDNDAGHTDPVATWTLPFGTAEAGKISLLTQHYYHGSPYTSANLLAPDTTLQNKLTALVAGAPSGAPVRISECNNFADPAGPDGLNNAFASSLWVLDFLYTCASYGATGVNLHGGNSGEGYEPIIVQSGVAATPQPEYYGLVLFNMAGDGTIWDTSTSDFYGKNVTAYAVMSSTGLLSIVVNNKDTAYWFKISITLPSALTYPSSFNIYELQQGAVGGTSPVLSGTSDISINLAEVTNGTAFSPGAPYTHTMSGNTAVCDIPMCSAVLIQIQTS